MTTESASAETTVKVPKNTRRRLYQSPGAEPVHDAAVPAVAGAPAAKVPRPRARMTASKRAHDSQEAGAARIVRKHVAWSAAAGIVPLPIVDAGLVSVVQLAMIRDLAALYGVPFSHTRAKVVVTALVGGLGSTVAGRMVQSRWVRAIPGIGQWMSVMTVPVFAATVTYAIGKVFVRHFEKGGTLAKFNPEGVREYFAQKLREGRGVIKSMVGQTA